MNNVKTKLIIAVTRQLTAAPDSDAKTDLIEELSENLYSRYRDMTASGMPEAEAYEKALGELGDVDELLAYLDGLGPAGELPGNHAAQAGPDPFRESAGSDWDRFTRWDGFTRQIVGQAREAAEDAAAMVRDAADQLRTGFSSARDRIIINGDDGDNVVIHADERGKVQVNLGGDAGASYSTDTGEVTAPSEKLGCVRVELTSGDIRVLVDDDPAAPVRVSGDTRELAVLISEDGGTLTVHQGMTASGRFFFGRAMRSTDIELTLPARRWENLSLATCNGEVEFDCPVEAGALNVKSSNGDISFRRPLAADTLNVGTDRGDVELFQVRAGQVNLSTASGDVSFTSLEAQTLNAVTASGSLELPDASLEALNFKTASGDLSFPGGRCGRVTFHSASGDLELSGDVCQVHAGTASGDIRLEGGGLEVIRCTTASGNVEARTDVLPSQLDVSTKSGDCQVCLPEGQGFTLQFRTMSGSLESDFQLTGPSGARSGRAVYLDGGERTFHMSSISGNMELLRR